MDNKLLRFLKAKKGTGEMLTIQTTNTNSFVALCKRFEVTMLFLSSIKAVRDDDEQSIDGGDKTVGTYRALIRFGGHDTYLQFDCSRMVPEGWRYHPLERTITKNLERKTDAEALLRALGADPDQVKRLMKVKASELHEIQDESTEDEEIITSKRKVSRNDFDFKLTAQSTVLPNINPKEAKLYISKEGFGRGTLGYRISIPFLDHIVSKRAELESKLKKEIPELMIYEAALA